MKKPNKITVRRISKGELYLVKALDQLIFGSVGCDAEPEEYDESDWWLAYNGKPPIAFAGSVTNHKDYVQLQRSGILPEYRGHGLQKRLIRARVSYSKAKGAKTVYTYCASWNSPSINSLISCGFKVYRPEINYGSEGDIYLIKQLEKS